MSFCRRSFTVGLHHVWSYCNLPNINRHVCDNRGAPANCARCKAWPGRTPPTSGKGAPSDFPAPTKITNCSSQYHRAVIPSAPLQTALPKLLEVTLPTDCHIEANGRLSLRLPQSCTMKKKTTISLSLILKRMGRVLTALPNSSISPDRSMFL